jgi:hypothetical protein
VSSVLDQTFQLGKESTYGTAVSLVRAFETQADGWKGQRDDLLSVGFSPAMQATRSDRVRTVEMGATGSTEWDILTKGQGYVFQGIFPTVTGPTQQASTTAYKSTFTTATASPGVYYTAQMQRVDSSDTLRSFTYKGATITKAKFSHKVGDTLKLGLDWDARTESTAVGAGSAGTVASATTFDWTQLNTTVNGTEYCLADMEVNFDLGLKTDRRLMCSTSAGLKRAPKRAAVPVVTGTITGEFDDLTNYALWTAGTMVPIIFTWTGANIASTYYYTVKLTLNNCKFTGETPQSSLKDMTMQPLPFMAYWDGTNAVASLEYTSTDTTL